MTALVPPDLIPNWIPGEKIVDSSHLGWSGLTLKGYHYPDQEANIPLMRDYMIVIYEGAAVGAGALRPQRLRAAIWACDVALWIVSIRKRPPR